MNKNQGYTLIELIIYIGIVSIIVVMVTNFAWDSIYSSVKNEALAEVNSNAYVVNERIGLAIRNAASIDTPANQGDTGSTLILTMPDSSTVTFSESGGTLQIDEGSGENDLTSNRVTVSDLTFTNLSRSGTSGNIRVQMKITNNNPSGKQPYEAVIDLDESNTLLME